MTNETFILLLKAVFKKYFEDGKSAGMEVKELVEDFRESVISDFCKNRKPTKSILKNRQNGNTKTTNDTAQ